MTGLILESVEEINQLLKEVTTYTIWGLAEPDVRVKQFYLERIYISLGMNLKEAREKLDLEIGINPEE